MSNLIKHSDGSSHFYRQDGTPEYEADLRRARKEGLLMSVTTVDKQAFPNPALERWKVEQAIIAGIDNPRQPHESVDQYAQRVYDLSTMKSGIAADFGTRVHKVIENYPAEPDNDELKPYFYAFHEWYIKSGLVKSASEVTVVDQQIGIAGRLDWEGMDTIGNRPALVDFKTQGMRPNDKGKKRPNFYPSWARQLGFYGVAKSKRDQVMPTLPACGSVVIDSTEPHEPYVKWWTDEEIRASYSEFICGAWLVHHMKSFWPVGQWKIQDHILL